MTSVLTNRLTSSTMKYLLLSVSNNTSRFAVVGLGLMGWYKRIGEKNNEKQRNLDS